MLVYIDGFIAYNLDYADTIIDSFFQNYKTDCITLKIKTFVLFLAVQHVYCFVYANLCVFTLFI